MTLHLGYIPASSTIYIPFHTFDSNGASITLTGLSVADVEIFKNGSVTQRSSDAGYTLLDTDGIDFDGITGLHGISIDLSDNTDAGFYAAGNFYMVAVASVTVDTRTVNFWAATFFIGPVAANMTQILGTSVSTPATAGILDVNVKNIDNDAASASGTVTFPNATLASTTNITAGTITTVTNLTNAATSGDLTATMKASVNTEADTALADVNLDHLVGTAASIPAIPAGTYVDQMMDDGTAVYDRTTDSLQAIRDSGGGAPSAASVADAVWDEARAGHVGAGSFGEGVIFADAAHGGTAAVLTLERMVVASTTGGEPGIRVSGGTNAHGLEANGNGTGEGISATGGAAGHGMQLTGGSSSGDGLRLVASAGNGHGLNTTGNGSGEGISSTGGATGNGAEFIGGATSGDGVRMVAATSGDGLDAQGAGAGVDINADNLLTAAQVNTEVLDVLNVDTFAEIGQEAPAATQTIRKMLAYLYKFLRNKKTQTATTLSVFADDATTVDQKATISDDGTTYTHGEIGTGP